MYNVNVAIDTIASGIAPSSPKALTIAIPMMARFNENILILIALLASVVAIVLYFIKHQHKFKMKLLEKDINPQDLNELLKLNKKSFWSWGHIALLLGFLSLFIGIGIGFGEILYQIFHIQTAYPFAIFLSAGIGLFGFYYSAKDENKREENEKKNKM